MVFYPNLHLGKSLGHQLCWFFSWPKTTEQSVIAGKLIVIPAARHTIIPCLPFLHNQRSSWGWHQLWRYSIWVAIWLPTSTDVAYCNLNIPWMVDEFTMNDCTKVLQSWQLSFAHYILIPTVLGSPRLSSFPLYLTHIGLITYYAPTDHSPSLYMEAKQNICIKSFGAYLPSLKFSQRCLGY